MHYDHLCFEKRLKSVDSIILIMTYHCKIMNKINIAYALNVFLLGVYTLVKALALCILVLAKGTGFLDLSGKIEADPLLEK